MDERLLPPGLNGRQSQLWRMVDFASGRGLEIGPLHNTTVRRELADVEYLDVFSREQLLANYASHTNVDPERIPEVDHVLIDATGRVRSIPETLAGVAPFDWVVASHVVEHVPDVVGWLDQLAQVIVDDGALVLVVPDRRYCFDVHRPGTTTGQLLQAHEAGDVVPSVRAVYDYKRGHVGTNAPALWRGEMPTYAHRLHDLAEVVEQVDRARAGEYVDSHVWAFTPGTLLEQVVELRELGLTAWRVETVTATRRNANEFYVVLRRLPRAGEADRSWPAALLADEPRPAHDMPDWLAEQAQQHAEQHVRVGELRQRLGRRRQRIERLERQLRRARKENRRLRRRLADAEARSLRRLPRRIARRVVGRLSRAVRRRTPRG